MNQTITNVEDVIIPQLLYKNKGDAASYVTSRRQTTFLVQGGNAYSNQGVTRMTYKLNGDSMEFIDTSTIMLSFTIKNDDPANHLKLVNQPYSLFRELRLYSNGVLIELISDYNRIHTMFSKLQTSGAQKHLDMLSYKADYPYPNSSQSSIPGAGSKKVFIPIFAGLFEQHLFLPSKFLNLTLEIDMSTNINDLIITNGANTTARAAPYAFSALVSGGASIPTLSSTFHIEDAKIYCDVCIMDSQISNSFSQYMLSGKPLVLPIVSYFSSMQSIQGNANPSLAINRSLTRIREIYITFTNSDFVNPSAPFKQHNAFLYPNQANTDITIQLQINSSLIPEAGPISSLQEFYYNLLKTIGVKANHSITDTLIDYTSYKDLEGNFLQTVPGTGPVPLPPSFLETSTYTGNDFIASINLERIINANFTGISTKDGSPINVRIRNVDVAKCNLVHVVLAFDAIVQISDIGTEILD